MASAHWSGRIGFVLASIGSAVGLGSIWKFPYEVGENGGAVFIAFYLAGLALVVVPLLLAELAIGRRGGGDVLASLAAVASEAGGSRRWSLVGALAVAGGFMILTYYAVFAGMAMAYAADAVLGGLGSVDAARSRAAYEGLVADPARLAAWQAGFLAASVAVVAAGIGGGIEAACKILMPVLAALMVGLVAYAAIEGDVAQAMAFLFAPRLEAITPSVAIEALGLGFFSIGVGLGVMVTYAAYAGPDFRLGRTAVVIVAGDTAISLLAGLAVFPLVFAHGLDPAAGPGLVFTTLPIAFSRLPGGGAVGAAFFALLFVAALASAISLLELAVAPVIRWTGWHRATAAALTGIACWIGGLPTVLSFGPWQDFRPLGAMPGIGGLGLYELIDGMASNVLLPATGFLLSIVAGWLMPPAAVADALGWRADRAAQLGFALRWLVPAMIALFAIFGRFL